MTYLICFILSLCFAYLAKLSASKMTFLIFSTISLTIMITLAALRDYSIGVDTLSYLRLNIYWQGATTSGSLIDYLKYYLINGSKEPLFALMLGVIAKVTGEYRVFLFLAQTVIMVGVYIGAYRMKEHANPLLTLLLFYLLYYNYTLNATRQYMALAILFAVVRDIEEGKYKRYIVFTIIATLIHNTSILGFALLLLYYLIYGRKELPKEETFVQRKKVSILRRIIIFGLLIGVFYFYDPISHTLINYGILNSKYLIYLDLKSNATFFASRMFLMVEIIGLGFFFKPFRNNNIHPDFFIFCSISFLLLFQLSTVIRAGARIARFFSLLNICTIGMIVNSQRGIKKQIICILTISIALLYWIYTYAYINYSYTFPYIIGI